MGNCRREKTDVDRGETEVDIGFQGMSRGFLIQRCCEHSWLPYEYSEEVYFMKEPYPKRQFRWLVQSCP